MLMASRLILDSSRRTLAHAMCPNCMAMCRPVVTTHTHRKERGIKSIHVLGDFYFFNNLLGGGGHTTSLIL